MIRRLAHTLASIPGRVLYGVRAAVEGPEPSAAYLRGQIEILEGWVRAANAGREAAERERDEARKSLAATWTQAVDVGRALRLTTHALSLAYQPPTDGIGRDVLTRAITAAAAALAAAQPGVTLDIAAVCGKLAERDALAAEVASLRARRAHLDAGPLVRRGG